VSRAPRAAGGPNSGAASGMSWKLPGATVVTALPSATGPIVGTAATLGFKPQWMLQGPSFLEQLITKDGNVDSPPTPVAAALKGALVTSFAAPWGDSAAAGMKQLVADHQQYSAKLPPSIYFTLAYAQGQVQAAILRKAIQSGNLTRAGILAAKQNLGTVDVRGIAPNVCYAPQPGPPTREPHHADRSLRARLPQGGRDRPRQPGRRRPEDRLTLRRRRPSAPSLDPPLTASPRPGYVGATLATPNTSISPTPFSLRRPSAVSAKAVSPRRASARRRSTTTVPGCAPTISRLARFAAGPK
jgi:hypothetical protein